MAAETISIAVEQTPHEIGLITAMGKSGNSVIWDESITLPTEKATRLVELFQRLNTGAHLFDCHDFVIGIEGWEGDIITDNRVITDDEPLEPGTAYQVLVNVGTEAQPDWIYTHSALGTDNGQLLAVAGEGLPVTIMARETALKIYSNGYPACLATVSLAEGDEPQIILP